MSDIQKIISKLNLKPLNIEDNSKLNYEKHNDIEIWTCKCQIEGIDCKLEIFGEKTIIQMYILPTIVCDNSNEWLRKINNVAKENIGIGIGCHIDTDSKTLTLKTSAFDLELNGKEVVEFFINDSIKYVARVLMSLIS